MLSDAADKPGRAFLTGNFNFSPSSGRTQVQAAAGAFEIFIILPLAEGGFLSGKPALDPVPDL